MSTFTAARADRIRQHAGGVDEGRWATSRAALERERCDRFDQLDELATDTAEAIQLGDEARLLVTRRLTERVEASLTEISAALCRLDDGTYGICEHCTNQIPDERLEILPTSRLCTPCQARTDAQGRRFAARGWPIAGPVR